TRKYLQQGGLPGAVAADYSNNLPRKNLETHIPQSPEFRIKFLSLTPDGLQHPLMRSPVDSKTLAYIYGRKYRRITLHTTHSQIPTTQKASYCLS
ncbi:hypothetical protein, partial [Mycobacterium arosiense]|uniref:hypothetical protein n=1 Tax=Mycobacterium arosiense TaxID=425468 RepID=UPI003F67775A